MNPTCFDNEAYLKEQSAEILRRIEMFDHKLYLEFGGKLMFDYHAARVLPGYDPNVKMRLLRELKDNAEILLCIFAGDIERKKIRADFGISYDVDALKLIDDLREWGIMVAGVVITRYEEQPSAVIFKNKLERRGIRVFLHRFTKGYPTDIDTIVSEEGYGANPYITTSKPLVVVTGPGPGSGKLATCLSQMYHDSRRNIRSGYAKFETFPIWDLPLKHPVNTAYEAATADLGDFNIIDSFHLEAYGRPAVNYNRDMEIYPVLQRILKRLTGNGMLYRSPTDMGVNRVSRGILDDECLRSAARQEIIRRYFRYGCEYAMGSLEKSVVQRAELLMEEVGGRPEDRGVVEPAREAARDAVRRNKGHKGIFCGAAIQLPDGGIVTGSNSPLMHAASSLVLRSVKRLANIPDKIELLPESLLESIGRLKKDVFLSRNVSLSLEETLIGLGIGAAADRQTQKAVDQLSRLRGCEAHMTHIPTPGDEVGFKRLGINLTSEPHFSSRDLFIG